MRIIEKFKLWRETRHQKRLAEHHRLGYGYAMKLLVDNSLYVGTVSQEALILQLTAESDGVFNSRDQEHWFDRGVRAAVRDFENMTKRNKRE